MARACKTMDAVSAKRACSVLDGDAHVARRARHRPDGRLQAAAVEVGELDGRDLLGGGKEGEVAEVGLWEGGLVWRI